MASPASITLLNVNDDPASLYLLSHPLRAAGYRVLEATSGSEALELARAEKPALVVLDVRLPDMNGLEVCRQLRASPGTKDVCILLTSAAFTSVDRRVAGLDSGADGYLNHPVAPDELIATVRSLLRGKETEHQLRAQSDELLALDRRKNHFLAMLAHEQRNPLSAISSAIAQLSEDDPTGSRARMLNVADRQTKHLARLVDDLLDFSRVATGKLQLHRSWVNLSEIVREFLPMAQRLANDRGITITVAITDKPAWLEADPARLQQILSNLVDNATKYSTRGGAVWLRLEVEENGAERWAKISVRDEGVGLREEDHARIFELFTQVDATLDKARGGLGIGLTLSKRLVELHEGNITVKSEGLGAGSEFTVRLPVKARSGEARSAQTAQLDPQAKPRRVLLVEDNADVRESTESLLSSWGHDVVTAGEGKEAIAIAARGLVDVALIDIGLPGMDGFEVARRIRQTRGADLYLIALTGHAGADTTRSAREAGFDIHLVKPFELDELDAVLKKAPVAN